MTPRDYAVTAHGNQEYGKYPYSMHLDQVHAIVSRVASTSFLPEKVAYLHDVLEDTATTADELRLLFGSDVTQAVEFVTDESGKNRKERKAKTNEKLSKVDGTTEVGSAALLVKLADRLANVLSCVTQGNEDLLNMYRREHSAFREAVYRPDLACINQQDYLTLQQELDNILAPQSLRNQLAEHLARENDVPLELASKAFDYVCNALGLEGLALQSQEEDWLTKILLLRVAEHLDDVGVSRATWSEGLVHAEQEIVRNAGRASRERGLTPADNPFEEGTDAHDLWRAGFEGRGFRQALKPRIHFGKGQT